MRHGSLFSGIGGFDLASEWMGWENVFHCEWNEFGQKVLKYYWPKAITYNDITKTDFSIHRGTIDILTGGFPCQPYSSAGKRLGKEDERHLWPEMLRTIREIQPTWVVGENVRGLTNWNGGLVFDEVQADLESEGYEVTPFLLPAASVNAPHRRDRIWFVAFNPTYSDGIFRSKRYGEAITSNRRENSEHKSKGDKIWDKHQTISGTGVSTDSDLLRCDKCIQHDEVNTGEGGFNAFGDINEGNNWQNFPTVSPICDGDDGISNRLDSITFSKWRNESIKAGGNAIVPQVVYQIFKAIDQYNQLNNQLTL
jgi:DNA (cytosine-5)-methyltransferase 1